MHELSKPSRATYRWLLLSLIIGSLVTAATLFTSHRAFASNNGDPFVLTVTATASNTYGYILDINNTLTNNQPALNVQATQVWTSTYDVHPTAVWYDRFDGEWTVFNEDIANIPLGTSFDISGQYTGGGRYLQVTATSSNISGDSMYINNAISNNKPNVAFLVTQDYTGTYDPHYVGVWYNGSQQQWAVFNEDGTALPIGATFDLELDSPGTLFIQTATVSNSYTTTINNSAMNNNPSLVPQVTPVWNAQGKCGCIFNNNPIGIWYNASAGRWVIYNVSVTPIPVGAEFFVSPELDPSN